MGTSDPKRHRPGVLGSSLLSRASLRLAVFVAGATSSLVFACASGGGGTLETASAVHGREPEPHDAGPRHDTKAPDGGAPEPSSDVSDAGVSEGATWDGPWADEGGTWEGGTTSDGGSVEASSPLCKGTVALAGGTTSSVFAATSVNGGAWSVTTFKTGSMANNPTLTPFGSGFVALFTSSGTNDLMYTALGSSTWSTPASAFASSCAGPAMALGPAGLVAAGSALSSVYLGTDKYYYQGSYTSSGWDCESGPLTPSGGSQSFGPSAPSVASVGTSLVAAFDGDDGKLYVQSQSSGTWSTANAISGAFVGTTPPTVLALTGGTSDLLLVYENVGDNKLYAVTRTSGTWSTLTDLDDYALSPASMAPLAGGGAVLLYLGTDGQAHSMTYDPAATPPWTAPVVVVSGATSLTTAPAVAAGLCGSDAIAEIVQPGGVELVTLAFGVWSAPTVVTGTAGFSFATIATSP